MSSKDTSKTTSIVAVDGEGKTMQLSDFQKFVKHIQSKAELDTSFNSADELAEKQVLKLLAAQDIDSLFAGMRLEGLTGLRDLDNGAEIQILGYRLVQSSRTDVGGRTNVYAIIDAVNLETGETMALDTGIERVVTFLVKAEMIDALPVSVRIQKRTTGTGNEMITFVPVPQRAHSA